MDIYYMHCNQMEAAHPSSGAVMLVTNVSHKGSSPPHPPSSPLHLAAAAAAAVCRVKSRGLYIPEESTDRGFAQLPDRRAQLFGPTPRGPVCKFFFALSDFHERKKKTKTWHVFNQRRLQPRRLAGAAGGAAGRRRARQARKASGQAA